MIKDDKSGKRGGFEVFSNSFSLLRPTPVLFLSSFHRAKSLRCRVQPKSLEVWEALNSRPLCGGGQEK